jgi:hypothetical protein
MPQKSRADRERRARREGKTVAVKAGDRGVSRRGGHGTKKSGRVVARAECPTGRFRLVARRGKGR